MQVKFFSKKNQNFSKNSLDFLTEPDLSCWLLMYCVGCELFFRFCFLLLFTRAFLFGLFG